MNNQQIVNELTVALGELDKCLETRELCFGFWDKTLGDYIFSEVNENSLLFLGWDEGEEMWKIEYNVDEDIVLLFHCDCISECVSRIKILAEMVLVD